MSIPYSAEKDDLYYPAKRAVFFPADRPLVTYVPPTSFAYEHLGEPYSINLARQVKFNPPQTEIDNDRTQAEKEYLEKYAWRIGDVPLRPLADHAPVNYVWPVTAAIP